MSDIRSLSNASYNGKLIYQLTDASALKDTDLFAISTTDNLTRKVSLSQIKASFNNDYYNKDESDDLLDELRQQIKDINDRIFSTNNDIAEFRNEFNTKLTNLDNTLSKKITDLDTKLVNWIMYGTSVPTTLPTGRTYLQYF